MWSEPRRAHPAGVIVYSAKFLGVLAAPVIGIMAFSGAGEGPLGIMTILLAALLVVFAVVGVVALAWAEWYRFTFSIEGRTLRVEHGLIVRKSTRLTPERIQSVDTKANLLFRVLGLVTVDVHTAGRGQAPEVSIPALTEEDARMLAAELRPQAASGDAAGGLQHESDPAGARPAASAPTWRLTTTETFLVGATSSAALLVIAATMPVMGGLVPVVFSGTPVAELVPVGSTAFFAVMGGFFAVLVVFGWLVGTVTTALTYWDFATARIGDEVRVERGLLQRETRTVPLGRIQAVRVIEGPLRQALGRATIGVDAAGIAAGDGQQTGPTVLHPLLTRPDIARFIDLMAPGHRVGTLLGLPERARRRYVIRAALLPLAVALPVAVLVPWGWLALALPVSAGAWGLLAYADAAWALHGGVLAIRYRHVARTTVLVRRLRIQSVAVSQHPLQRIAGLATLVVHVASSPQPATFRLAHMEYDDALRVVQWVSDGVQRDV